MQNKKRVLIFSITYQPFIGGAELAIQEITKRILDIEFDLITLRFDKNLPCFERIGNINVYRVGFTKNNPQMSDLISYPLKLNKFLFLFFAFQKAKKLHQQNNYNVVWAMMANYAGFAASFFKKKYTQVPFLLTLQEGDPIDYIKNKVKFIYPAFQNIFKRADYIQTISNYLAEFAKDMNFQKELKVIPNAVDIKHFSQKFKDEELLELKKKLEKKDNDIFLITTSRLVKKNGINDVIDSLVYLDSNIKFLILGNGPDEKKLKTQVEELDLKNRVKFLGLINHKEMPKYLAISDIFIRPSLSEGLGNSFLEAMASGLPVIATPVGGIPDFLFDPDKNKDKKPTGLFCNVQDPQSIAKQLKRFLNNSKEKEEIIDNAKKMVIGKYDWNIVAMEMKNIFINLSK